MTRRPGSSRRRNASWANCKNPCNGSAISASGWRGIRLRRSTRTPRRSRLKPGFRVLTEILCVLRAQFLLDPLRYGVEFRIVGQVEGRQQVGKLAHRVKERVQEKLAGRVALLARIVDLQALRNVPDDFRDLFGRRLHHMVGNV